MVNQSPDWRILFNNLATLLKQYFFKVPLILHALAALYVANYTVIYECK